MFVSKVDYFTVDTLVVGNKANIAYDNFFLKQNGYIEQINVMPVRGPLPRKETPCNLTGNGKGYLYFCGTSRYIFRKIYLGTGTGSKVDYAHKNKTQSELTEQFNQSIMKKLGVSK